MAKYLLGILCVAALAIFALPVRAADDVVSAVHGTVTKVDSGTKTIVVKSKDGTEHSIHYVDKTAVHGADVTEAAGKDSYKGIKEGSEVVVHYTEKGTEKTGVEIDRVGKDGVKTVDGTVEKVGEGGKTIVVKAPTAPNAPSALPATILPSPPKKSAKAPKRAPRSPSITPMTPAKRWRTFSRSSNAGHSNTRNTLWQLNSD